MGELLRDFHRFFRVEPVVTEEELHSALRLRYQVYCVETGFEDVTQHPDELERDAYDSRAVHSLLIHNSTRSIAGTVRLVLPEPGKVEAPFPIEQHCGVTLDALIPSWGEIPRAQVAEISRFCISKEFKRRVGEPNTVWGAPGEIVAKDLGPHQSRLIPHITVGLFAGIVQLSVTHHVGYWYAVMEPALLRLLRRFGIRFHPIGPVVDYHGQRQPCFAVADEVLAEMERECPEVWRLITREGTLWPAQATRPSHSRRRCGLDDLGDFGLLPQMG